MSEDDRFEGAGAHGQQQADQRAEWPGVNWAQPPAPSEASPHQFNPSGGWPTTQQARRGKPDPMPDGEREYPQMLRGGRHRWWKPILSILMFVAAFFVLTNLLSLLLIPIGLLAGHSTDLMGYLNQVLSGGEMGPVAFAFTNVILALATPLAMLSVWAVHRIRPGYLISVQGRFRWRWFSRCLLVLLPLWALYVGLGTLLDPPAGGRPPQFVALIVIMLLTTPLQCAGEEFAFRGFLVQTIGSWFSSRWLAVLVPLPFSVALFAMAHGSPHPWVLIDLGAFAAGTFVLAWRTGGLEAGIALHMLNNMLLMLLSLVFGGWGEGFVDKDTTGSPWAALISLVVNALAVALIWWQADRVKLVRTYQPTPRLAGPPPSSPQYSPQYSPQIAPDAPPTQPQQTAPAHNPWLHP